MVTPGGDLFEREPIFLGVSERPALFVDEFKRLGDSIPDIGSRLGLAKPLKGKLRDLAPEDLDVVQLALEKGDVQSIISAAGDDDGLSNRLVKLIKGGYLAVEG